MFGSIIRRSYGAGMDSTEAPRRRRAYRVPFEVHRNSRANTYTIVNVGTEAVRGVTLTLHGSGVMKANPPAVLGVGDALEVVVIGDDLPANTILVVRWFRPNGVEYLWRISF